MVLNIENMGTDDNPNDLLILSVLLLVNTILHEVKQSIFNHDIQLLHDHNDVKKAVKNFLADVASEYEMENSPEQGRVTRQLQSKRNTTVEYYLLPIQNFQNEEEELRKFVCSAIDNPIPWPV